MKRDRREAAAIKRFKPQDIPKRHFTSGARSVDLVEDKTTLVVKRDKEQNNEYQ